MKTSISPTHGYPRTQRRTSDPRMAPTTRTACRLERYDYTCKIRSLPRLAAAMAFDETIDVQLESDAGQQKLAQENASTSEHKPVFVHALTKHSAGLNARTRPLNQRITIVMTYYLLLSSVALSEVTLIISYSMAIAPVDVHGLRWNHAADVLCPDASGLPDTTLPVTSHKITNSWTPDNC